MKLPSMKKMLVISFNVFLLIAIPALIMGELAQILPQEVLDKGDNVIVTGPNLLVFLAVLLYPVELGIVLLRPRILLFPFNDVFPNLF
jgi:hypothetical protein